MSKGTKSGGRKKGSLNKRSLEALEVFGDFCPLEMILEKLKDQSVQANEELFLNTCLKLMKFKFPERKAIDHRAEIELRKAEIEQMTDEELVETTLKLAKQLGIKPNET